MGLPNPRPSLAASVKFAAGHGHLLAYLARGDKSLLTFLAPKRARAWTGRGRHRRHALRPGRRRVARALVLASIDGASARGHALGEALLRVGFAPVGEGYVLRYGRGSREGSRAGR